MDSNLVTFIYSFHKIITVIKRLAEVLKPTD